MTNRTPRQEAQVLVVDDEETVRRSIQKRLEKEGYRVIAIDRGPDALKIFETVPFDVVVSDIRMEEMDGMELLGRIQALEQDVPVIMVTGAPSLETAQESVRRGAYDYITKPIEREVLRQTVRRAVEKKRLNDRLKGYQRELEARVQEQTKIITALFQMANQLNALETLEDVLGSVTQGVHRYTRSEHVLILLRRDETDRLVYAHGMGLDEPLLRRQQIALSAPVAQEIVQAEGAIRIQNGLIESLPGETARLLGRAPWLGVGLRYPKNPFGIILASERLPEGDYTNDELQILTYIGDSASIAIHNQLVGLRLQESYLNIIQALAYAIEAKDPYTRGHSERVRNYVVRLAERLALSEEERQHIDHAAILHDIGKVEVSKYIIQKPARLTVEEYTDMKDHPAIGEIMVEGISFLERARPLIRHHHERWDGRGYPDGLGGEEIPLGARIIAIADIYDALTTQRPYRNDTSRERAILRLRQEKGTHLDPRLVEEFVCMIQHMG